MLNLCKYLIASLKIAVSVVGLTKITYIGEINE